MGLVVKARNEARSRDTISDDEMPTTHRSAFFSPERKARRQAVFARQRGKGVRGVHG